MRPWGGLNPLQCHQSAAQRSQLQGDDNNPAAACRRSLPPLPLPPHLPRLHPPAGFMSADQQQPMGDTTADATVAADVVAGGAK